MIEVAHPTVFLGCDTMNSATAMALLFRADQIEQRGEWLPKERKVMKTVMKVAA